MVIIIILMLRNYLKYAFLVCQIWHTNPNAKWQVEKEVLLEASHDAIYYCWKLMWINNSSVGVALSVYCIAYIFLFHRKFKRNPKPFSPNVFSQNHIKFSSFLYFSSWKSYCTKHKFYSSTETYFHNSHFFNKISAAQMCHKGLSYNIIKLTLRW